MAEQDSYESLKAENDRLLLIVISERQKMVSQITRVQNLKVLSQKTDQELRTLEEKNEQLESSLASAENRIMTRLSTFLIVHVNYFLYIFQHWFVAKVVAIQRNKQTKKK